MKERVRRQDRLNAICYRTLQLEHSMTAWGTWTVLPGTSEELPTTSKIFTCLCRFNGHPHSVSSLYQTSRLKLPKLPNIYFFFAFAKCTCVFNGLHCHPCTRCYSRYGNSPCVVRCFHTDNWKANTSASAWPNWEITRIFIVTANCYCK
jgi:hypothetical protein